MPDKTRILPIQKVDHRFNLLPQVPTGRISLAEQHEAVLEKQTKEGTVLPVRASFNALGEKVVIIRVIKRAI